MAGRLARALSAIEKRFASPDVPNARAETAKRSDEPTFGTNDTFGTRGGCVSEPVPPAPSPVHSGPFSPGVLGEWQRRFAALRPDEPPCSGFRHWPTVYRATMHFLHDQGEEAVRLGWSELDLFGVHVTAGAVRVDCTGALVTLRGKRVMEITPFLIRFADGLAYRRRPMSAGLTVAIWNFGGSSC